MTEITRHPAFKAARELTEARALAGLLRGYADTSDDKDWQEHRLAVTRLLERLETHIERAQDAVD